MERILLIMQASACADCMRALDSARHAAAAPEGLSMALCLLEPVQDAEREELRTFGQVRLMAPSEDAWRDFPSLWQGEPLVLMGHPGMRFERNWDRALIHTLESCRHMSDYPVALTGCLPRPEDPVDAVSPVAAVGYDRLGRLRLGRGTPLRYAAQPVRSAFLHPDFCFAGADLFRVLAEEEEPYFLAAFRRKWELYTLDRPVIHLLWDDPVPPCALPLEDEDAARFGRRYGVDPVARTMSAAAQEGVWTADMTFPIRVPVAVRLQERLRDLDNRASRLDPLVVTAWMELPDNPDTDRAMLHLKRLATIRNLPLLCFADAQSVRRVTRACPYVLEYKARYGLPMQTRVQPADLARYARLSRPFLLAQSREKDLARTHYIWIEPDYLAYPVYERAALDWETVCTDRIVLARVAGELDLSMIVSPEGRLLPLCHEVAALCENAVLRTGRLPEEMEIWKLLVHEHPDWFHLIELPGRRELLSLTMAGRDEEWLARP